VRKKFFSTLTPGHPRWAETRRADQEERQGDNEHYARHRLQHDFEDHHWRGQRRPHRTHYEERSLGWTGTSEPFRQVRNPSIKDRTRLSKHQQNIPMVYAVYKSSRKLSCSGKWATTSFCDWQFRVKCFNCFQQGKTMLDNFMGKYDFQIVLCSFVSVYERAQKISATKIRFGLG